MKFAVINDGVKEYFDTLHSALRHVENMFVWGHAEKITIEKIKEE